MVRPDRLCSGPDTGAISISDAADNYIGFQAD